ncbi:MAG TPA: hypothetical protein VF746_25220 [Longimicrobium sp.]|jgi:hypothetical protein
MVGIGRLIGPGPIEKAEVDLLSAERELEALRSALRREIAVHRGLAGVAEEIGVGRIVLRKFLALETVPIATHLSRIRDWAENRPPGSTPLASVLLAALTRDLPGTARSRVRRELAEALASGHHRAGDSVPEWVRSELGMDAPPARRRPTRRRARAVPEE